MEKLNDKLVEILKTNGYGLAVERNNPVELKDCVERTINRLLKVIETLEPETDEWDAESLEIFNNEIKILRKYLE